MPAESEAQRRAAGAALAAKRGKTDPKALVGASRQMYEDMSERQLEDFAGSVKEAGREDAPSYALAKSLDSRCGLCRSFGEGTCAKYAFSTTPDMVCDSFRPGHTSSEKRSFVRGFCHRCEELGIKESRLKVLCVVMSHMPGSTGDAFTELCKKGFFSRGLPADWSMNVSPMAKGVVPAVRLSKFQLPPAFRRRMNQVGPDFGAFGKAAERNTKKTEVGACDPDGKLVKLLQYLKHSSILVDGKKVACDLIAGGKADGMDTEEFPKDQIEAGRKVEMEHTDDPELAKEIARDHLVEAKDYYKPRLNDMEEEMKKDKEEGKVEGVGKERYGNAVSRSEKKSDGKESKPLTKSDEDSIRTMIKSKSEIDDYDFHRFVEDRGLNPHAAEELVYKMLHRELSDKGKAAGFSKYALEVTDPKPSLKPVPASEQAEDEKDVLGNVLGVKVVKLAEKAGFRSGREIDAFVTAFIKRAITLGPSKRSKAPVDIQNPRQPETMQLAKANIKPQTPDSGTLQTMPANSRQAVGLKTMAGTAPNSKVEFAGQETENKETGLNY